MRGAKPIAANPIGAQCHEPRLRKADVDGDKPPQCCQRQRAHYGCLLIVERRIAMGYYKRMIPVYRNRNPFLKRLSFRLAYMKPSRITFLACLVILLAGAVMAVFFENILPENFAELVNGPNQ